MLKRQQGVEVLKRNLSTSMGILGATKHYPNLGPSVFLQSVQTRNVRLSFIGSQKDNSFYSDPKGTARQMRRNHTEVRRPSTTE